MQLRAARRSILHPTAAPQRIADLRRQTSDYLPSMPGIPPSRAQRHAHDQCCNTMVPRLQPHASTAYLCWLVLQCTISLPSPPHPSPHWPQLLSVPQWCHASNPMLQPLTCCRRDVRAVPIAVGRVGSPVNKVVTCATGHTWQKRGGVSAAPARMRWCDSRVLFYISCHASTFCNPSKASLEITRGGVSVMHHLHLNPSPVSSKLALPVPPLCVDLRHDGHGVCRCRNPKQNGHPTLCMHPTDAHVLNSS